MEVQNQKSASYPESMAGLYTSEVDQDLFFASSRFMTFTGIGLENEGRIYCLKISACNCRAEGRLSGPLAGIFSQLSRRLETWFIRRCKAGGKQSTRNGEPLSVTTLTATWLWESKLSDVDKVKIPSFIWFYKSRTKYRPRMWYGCWWKMENV